MNEHNADSFNDVPTLVNVVVPGDAEKRRAPQTSLSEEPEPAREQLADPYPAEASQSGKYSFRNNIDSMIEEVLNRHLVQARKEITARVISEIVSHRNKRS
jgi:hypothetical protein